MYSETQLIVRRHIHEGRNGFSRGFSYAVFDGTSRLVTAENRSLYDAIDEAMSILLGNLARGEKRTFVRIKLEGPHMTEWIKSAIFGKYSVEQQFVGVSFD